MDLSFSSCVCMIILVLQVSSRVSHGFGTFGFDIHHRFSDPVKGVLDVGDLPEIGSPKYVAAMAHRDRFVHGRRLAASSGVSELAFLYGNETVRIDSLGFLHYANVSVGTPSKSYLVALDTGSDLFWLPCDCTSCVRALGTSSGQKIELNIYSPNTSSTSSEVSCSSSLCPRRNQCSAELSNCPYQVAYLSNNTSSSGYLVEDVLLLVNNDAPSHVLNANVTFGCGRVQTGSFLDGAAPNGLFGLGMTNISVPSILASEGYASNSFSMCFGSNGFGRIVFGDKGSSGQGETPFNPGLKHPTYNITITQISVGGNGSDLEYNAIFDSGTSFTYLNDPAYSLISDTFDSHVKEQRRTSLDDVPFEYCYDISPTQKNLVIPTVDLLMKGGQYYNVTDPIVVVPLENNAYVYCLGIVKSGDVNIIGQNFMTGYRIIFDREKMVLGWTPSNCSDDVQTNNLPISPSSSVPPATAVNPVATSNNSSGSGTTSPDGSHSLRSSPLRYALITVVIPFFIIF